VFEVAVVLITAIVVLLIAYLTAISSKDLIRLLISLEMMFGAIFLAMIPVFSIPEMTTTAFGILVVAIFTSCSELLVLIASIVLLDKATKDVSTDAVSTGGDSL
jgi:NADH-quinone oxidoreductase subunit K